jgi:iron(III) transport system permease protein
MKHSTARYTTASAAGSLVAALMWTAGILCVLPVLVMITGTFWQDGHLSLSNISAAYSNLPRLAELTANSLIIVSGTVAISLLVGTPLGYLCFRTNMICRRAIILGAIVAACIPIYVTATSWMALFGMRFWLYSAWGASWIQGMAYAPIVLLLTGICFASQDRHHEEDASMDSARLGVIRHVTIPQGAWAMVLAGMTVAILSVADITVTDILTVRTFPEEVFTQFQLGSGPWRATAISIPMIACSLGLTLLVWRLLRSHGEMTPDSMGRQLATIPLGKWRVPLAIIAIIAFTACFIVPSAALIKATGSLKNLATSYRTAETELLGTLRVTPIAATICSILALGGAWAIVKMPRGRFPALMILVILISAPAPVVGIGLIKLLNHPGPLGRIYNSEAVLVAAYIIRALPFGILALIPAVKRIPQELDDTLKLAGGTWIQQAFSVVIPMCWRGILVSWLLIFVLSLSELGASFLVIPPGQATLSLRFFTLIHYGVYPDAAGICLILLGIVSVAAAGIAALIWPVASERMA